MGHLFLENFILQLAGCWWLNINWSCCSLNQKLTYVFHVVGLEKMGTEIWRKYLDRHQQYSNYDYCTNEYYRFKKGPDIYMQPQACLVGNLMQPEQCSWFARLAVCMQILILRASPASRTGPPCLLHWRETGSLSPGEDHHWAADKTNGQRNNISRYSL